MIFGRKFDSCYFHQRVFKFPSSYFDKTNLLKTQLKKDYPRIIISSSNFKEIYFMDPKANQTNASAAVNFGSHSYHMNKNNINPNPSIVVNLRECKYDIFRRVSQDHFQWEALLSQEYYQSLKVKQSDSINNQQTGAHQSLQAAHSQLNNVSGKEPGDGCDSDSQQLTTTATSATLVALEKPSNLLAFTNRSQLKSSKRYTINNQQPKSSADEDKQTSNATGSSQNATGEKPQQQQSAISYQWDILWFDHGGLTPEFLSSMLPWQRVNHFLGMYNIARKNTLGIHLKRFLKEFPKDYKFFPNTWLYPAEFFEINEYSMQKAAKRKQMVKDGEMSEEQDKKEPVVLFICKPEASSQGKGIFIVKRLDDMRLQLNSQLQAQLKQYQEYLQAQEYYDTALMYSQKLVQPNTSFPNQGHGGSYGASNPLNFSVNQDQSQSGLAPPGSSKDAPQASSGGVEAPQFVEKQNTFVIQKYMKQPALINGHKFDFRIYVLITSVIDPLSIFMFKDGLVRLASEKYSVGKNIQDMYTHLTNYSLNKKNHNFDGSKHKLTLSECLKGSFRTSSEKGTFAKQSEQIWLEIEDIVIKTVITIQPQLQHYYRSSQPKEPDLCYELLGFDIILDYKLRPWLLEVNHLPSFNSDTQTDEQVKYELIRDVFSILQLSIEHRKKVHKEMKAEQLKQSQQQGCFRRLSVKEHVDRVRFDPSLVQRLNPQNKFKLIYPKPANSSEQDASSCYEKYQRKANEIWQMTTGTFRQQNAQSNAKEEKKKKKLIKTRHRKQSQQLQHQTVEQIAGESLTGQPKRKEELEQIEPYQDADSKTRGVYDGSETERERPSSSGGSSSVAMRLRRDVKFSQLAEGLKRQESFKLVVADEAEEEGDNQDSDKLKESKGPGATQQSLFFEKRQSSNLRPSTNVSNLKYQTKQNTQRQVLKTNVKQLPPGVQTLRSSVNNQRNASINNYIRHNKNSNLLATQIQPEGASEPQTNLFTSFGFKSNDNLTSQVVDANENEQIKEEEAIISRQQSLGEPEIQTLTSPYNKNQAVLDASNTDASNEIMIKLSQNKGTLKYKEYCKALIDEFNQAYYKSAYKSSYPEQVQGCLYPRGNQAAANQNGLSGENSRSQIQSSITQPLGGKNALTSQQQMSSKRSNKTEIVTSMSSNPHLNLIQSNKFSQQAAQPGTQIHSSLVYQTNFNMTNGTLAQTASSYTNYKLKYPSAKSQAQRTQPSYQNQQQIVSNPQVISQSVAISNNISNTLLALNSNYPRIAAAQDREQLGIEVVGSPGSGHSKIQISSALNKNQPLKSHFSHQQQEHQAKDLSSNFASSFQDQASSVYKVISNQKTHIPSSLIRSKEDLPAYALNGYQRQLARSDSFKSNNQVFKKQGYPPSVLQQKIMDHIYVSNGIEAMQNEDRQHNGVNEEGTSSIAIGAASSVEMASINLSAGLLDFKISYKKHNKRFNPGGGQKNLKIVPIVKQQQQQQLSSQETEVIASQPSNANQNSLQQMQSYSGQGNAHLIAQAVKSSVNFRGAAENGGAATTNAWATQGGTQQQQLFHNFINSPPQLKAIEQQLISFTQPNSSHKNQKQQQRVNKKEQTRSQISEANSQEKGTLDRLRQFEQKLLMNHSLKQN